MIVTWSECASAVKTRPVCSSRPMSIGSLPVGDLADDLVRLEVDDRDEVAARAGDERAPSRDVDRDPLRVEPDRDLGDLPPRRARVDPARGSDRERRVFSGAGRRHVNREYRASGERAAGGTRAAISRIGAVVADAVLIYADSFRSADMRHAVPLGVPDPFLYAEAEREPARLRELDGGGAAARARPLRRPRPRGVRHRRADRVGDRPARS